MMFKVYLQCLVFRYVLEYQLVSDGPELVNPSSNGACLSSNEITMIYRKSHSRRNFSSKLVCRLFDKIHAKLPMLLVRWKSPVKHTNNWLCEITCISVFPLHPHEKKGKAWADCILAIDEGNRRLNNKPTKKS